MLLQSVASTANSPPLPYWAASSGLSADFGSFCRRIPDEVSPKNASAIWLRASRLGQRFPKIGDWILRGICRRSSVTRPVSVSSRRRCCGGCQRCPVRSSAAADVSRKESPRASETDLKPSGDKRVS